MDPEPPHASEVISCSSYGRRNSALSRQVSVRNMINSDLTLMQALRGSPRATKILPVTVKTGAVGDPIFTLDFKRLRMTRLPVYLFEQVFA